RDPQKLRGPFLSSGRNSEPLHRCKSQFGSELTFDFGRPFGVGGRARAFRRRGARYLAGLSAAGPGMGARPGAGPMLGGAPYAAAGANGRALVVGCGLAFETGAVVAGGALACGAGATLDGAGS